MTQPLTLREARERRRPPFTQVQLAEKADVDQTYVSLIERGKRTPSDDIKRRLAEALGVAPSRLRFPKPQPTTTVDPSLDSPGHERGDGVFVSPPRAAASAGVR
jgi:transcriptional regulator with XRE-family HTH domain